MAWPLSMAGVTVMWAVARPGPTSSMVMPRDCEAVSPAYIVAAQALASSSGVMKRSSDGLGRRAQRREVAVAGVGCAQDADHAGGVGDLAAQGHGHRLVEVDPVQF